MVFPHPNFVTCRKSREQLDKRLGMRLQQNPKIHIIQTGLTPKNGSDFLIRILFFGPRVCLE